MPKVYDDALKKLFKANAQDFVSLIQEGLRVEELLPTELDAEHIYADGLARCRNKHGQPLLAHFEYQREQDDRMGERMLEYNVMASRLNEYLPVVSCVIYLKKTEGAPRSPFVREVYDSGITTIFYYACLDLGETTVEELLAKGLPGLLPLLPLTSGGKEHGTIDIMIESLVEAGKTDLLWIGYVLAAKIFTSDGDLQWLKGRFALMNDFLWDSPIYQEIVTEVETKGIETGKMQALSRTRQELSQGLLDMVKTRFPALIALARKCAKEVSDTSALTHLLVKVGMAQTEQEAKEALQSCLNV